MNNVLWALFSMWLNKVFNVIEQCFQCDWTLFSMWLNNVFNVIEQCFQCDCLIFRQFSLKIEIEIIILSVHLTFCKLLFLIFYFKSSSVIYLFFHYLQNGHPFSRLQVSILYLPPKWPSTCKRLSLVPFEKVTCLTVWNWK